MRYVYQITNYPDATAPVYATLLVHKGQIIGGDITDTSARGVVQGFKLQNLPQPIQPTEPSLPEETTTATE